MEIDKKLKNARVNSGLTQEQVAEKLMVSRQTISNWETGQSMPDIMLLPEIATYFHITIDALLGYEPQLSKEQIQKVYGELCEDFAMLSFEETFAKSEALVRKYYSCYLFLLQICVLWLNHFMLAEGKERQEEILVKLQELCNHILNHCTNTEICSDVLGIRASVDLLCGRPQNAIDGISDLLKPNRVLNQSDGLLIQAYIMNGEPEKADSFTQAALYLHLLLLVGDSTCFLSMHMRERELCEETIARTDAVINAYHMDVLNPNVTAGFHYQAAIFESSCGEKEKAIERLQNYAELVCSIMKKGNLDGDSYFDKLDTWFEELDLGTQMPRSKKILMQNARENLNHPAFEALRGLKEFQKIDERLAEESKG